MENLTFLSMTDFNSKISKESETPVKSFTRMESQEQQINGTKKALETY